MSVDTHVRDALERAETERTHVKEKRAAFTDFEAAVREIETASRGRSGNAMADGGMTATATNFCRSGADNQCKQVRTCFEEAVRPVLRADRDQESTVESIRGEFCDEVALALSPHTDSQFTPNVKQVVLTAAGNRSQELGALGKALTVECESLETAANEISEMTTWLAEADETPLLELGFEGLRERHARLSESRDRCSEIADRRQETLETTTSFEASAGIEHQGVVDYLYDDFPASHPILSTTTKLSAVCADCQRAVRDHLTRRV